MTDEALISQVAALERKTDSHSEQLGMVSRAVEALHGDVRDIKAGLFGDPMKDPGRPGLIAQLLEGQKKCNDRHAFENKVLFRVFAGMAGVLALATSVAVTHYTQKILNGDRGQPPKPSTHIEQQATIPRDVATEPPVRPSDHQ